jgi:molecular chaperone GrpE
MVRVEKLLNQEEEVIKKKGIKTSEDGVFKESQTAETCTESEGKDEEKIESAAQSTSEASDSMSIEKLEEENRVCQDKLLRLAAEFENYKKRMIRERQASLKYAEQDILKDLLPAIDNLERAINQEEATRDVNSLLEGVQLTLKGLEATVTKYGLEPIESVGKPFDPNLHEALVMEASSEIPAQSVLREFEKGYLYKDRLLRAAKVVVSKGQE